MGVLGWGLGFWWRGVLVLVGYGSCGALAYVLCVGFWGGWEFVLLGAFGILARCVGRGGAASS